MYETEQPAVLRIMTSKSTNMKFRFSPPPAAIWIFAPGCLAMPAYGAWREGDLKVCVYV